MTRPRPVFVVAVLVACVASFALVWRTRPRDHSEGSAASPVHVLYVGNSFTYVNNLPALVRALGLADGQDLAFTTHGVAYASLEDHARSSDVDDLLASPWTFVVLQEQSQSPAYSNLRAKSEPALSALVRKAREHDSEPLLFATWAYRNGDPDNVRNDTYDAMQDRLDAGFATLAKNAAMRIVPVSTAWRESRHTHPEWDLWGADGHHPALAGSYLAACVFYETIARRSPRGNAFTAGLPTDEAFALQDIAARAMPPAASK